MPLGIEDRDRITSSNEKNNQILSTVAIRVNTDGESNSDRLGLEEKENEFVLYLKEVKNAIQDLKIRQKRFRKWICGCGSIQV